MNAGRPGNGQGETPPATAAAVAPAARPRVTPGAQPRPGAPPRPGAGCPPPLFILGAARSFTSLISTMIGQHPQAYGFPELNLFLADTVEDLLESLGGFKQIQLHGLLRSVAHLYGGEQTLVSLDMARRWMLRRIDHSTAAVYRELCAKVAPLHAVDKSPAYVLHDKTLAAIRDAFPDAYYLHLTRHPRGQGQSIMNIGGGMMAMLANSLDYAVSPPVVDPQIAWLRVQRTIRRHLAAIPPARRRHARGEDILADPDRALAALCRWLGWRDDARAIAAIKHPERSPFAHLGPFGAHLGNDINFLQNPRFTPREVVVPTLAGPLPWRADGAGFMPETLEMARDLGYS